MRKNEPYIEFFRRFLKTASYERLIETMRDSFESRGVRTSVFKSRWLHQFVLCMWTSRRRNELAERAKDHEALVVMAMGCEGAVQTVQNSLGSTACRVIQGMRSDGLMSVKPRLSLLGNVKLELESVNPLLRLQPKT